MKANEIAQHAAGLVSGDRDRTHGEKHGNHARIAAFWNAYVQSRFVAAGLPVQITPRDVACMMVALKLARSTFGAHNADDYVDMVGYAAIAGELADRDAEIADRILSEKRPQVSDDHDPATGAMRIGAHPAHDAVLRTALAPSGLHGLVPRDPVPNPWPEGK